MKTLKFLFIIWLLSQVPALGQWNPNWCAFTYKVDLIEYRKGKFILEAYVKADVEDKKSQAQLWARIDGKGKNFFFDNMKERPIRLNSWNKYIIEGDISGHSDTLSFGGLCIGFGKCYYDDFVLLVKKKNGDYQRINLPNADYENKIFFDTWNHSRKEGYKWALDSITPHNGKYSLLIDGNERAFLNYGNNKRVGKYIDVNGIHLYYEIYGEGEPIILLHGNSESMGSFRYQIPELSKHLKVILIDSRGQGNSSEDGKKLTYELMAEDINAFMESLALKNINILGWSDGGNIALILTMNHPDKVKKIAVMGANLYNNRTSVSPKITKAIIKYRNQLQKENNPEMRFKIELLNLMINEPKIQPEQLKKIACPTLIMAGSKDVIKQKHTQLIANNIKLSKLVIFKNGSHYEPQKNPLRFNKTVIEFIQEK